MSSNWKEKLKSQLNEKEITSESSESSIRSENKKETKTETSSIINTRKILSQSILIKRMCITVLKQYQNKLTSPLAQDAQELLSFLGYDPKQIIEEIKETKRKKTKRK